MLIETTAQLRQRIAIQRRQRTEGAKPAAPRRRTALASVLHHIESICSREREAASATRLRRAN